MLLLLLSSFLLQIGLTKLTKILRGAVRIEKNPELCYASTIDWNEIVVNGENFIKDNQNPADCRGKKFIKKYFFFFYIFVFTLDQIIF